MAYTTGTITTPTNSIADDLITALNDFATLNGWTSVENNIGNVILSNVGDSGTEKIYIQLYSNAAKTAIIFNGGQDYNASLYGTNTYEHNLIPLDPAVAAEYWYFTDGLNYIAGVIRQNTYYLHFYLGFTKRFGTQGHYRYPLFIGGVNTTANTPSLYSTENDWPFHSTRWDDACNNYGIGADNKWCMAAVMPTHINFTPYPTIDGQTDVLYNLFVHINTGTSLSFGDPDDYPNYPMGELYGVYMTSNVTGLNNGDTLTIDGVNYLVFSKLNLSQYWIAYKE